MTVSVEAFQADIEQIVASVFETMLGLTAFPVPGTTPGSPEVTAAIFFAGAWKGAALVECSLEQARAWTARLMEIDTPPSFTGDVQDAMGELANMVGGNLKSVLPRGTTLSMPSVVRGENYSLRICGDHVYHREGFTCGGDTFWVTLVEVEN